MSPIFKQFLAVICCNLLTLSCGLSLEWKQFNIGNQVTRSLFGIIIGYFVIPPFGRVYGLKNTIHALAIPLIIRFLITFVRDWNYFGVAIAETILGFVIGGLFIGIPLLINEISYDKVRGALISLFYLMLNIGIFTTLWLQMNITEYDQWKNIQKSFLALPIIFAILLCLFPESPEFLIKNSLTKAVQSYRFYKGWAEETLIETADGQTIIIIKTDGSKANLLTHNDFLTPQAKKACFISFGSFILCFANGSSLMALYLYKAISAPDGIEIDVLLLFSFATIIGNVLFSCVVDLISRKILYVFSALFTMLSFLLLTIYIHMNRLDFEYICLTCFACITLFSNMGLRQMPLIVSNEVLPKKIRSVGIVVVPALLLIFLFIAWLIVDFMHFKPLPYMILMVIVSLLNVIFGIIFIPNTRAKSSHEIQQLFIK